ncbi:MAG: hypothetical protein ACJAUP_003303 [Cellvibrionaceae bacterium]|jgi:hypothetical protein
MAFKQALFNLKTAAGLPKSAQLLVNAARKNQK